MFFWITFTFCSSPVSWQQPEDDFEPENQTDWKNWRVTAGGRRQKRLNCRINDPFNYSWELPGEEESPTTKSRRSAAETKSRRAANNSSYLLSCPTHNNPIEKSVEKTPMKNPSVGPPPRSAASLARELPASPWLAVEAAAVQTLA